MQEPDETKRMDLYRQADQVQIDDGAIMPIFYDEYYRLIQKNVKNFPANAMEYRDFTRVYLEPQAEKNEAKK
jgi:oligopeptide transport system substrate-binding protein